MNANEYYSMLTSVSAHTMAELRANTTKTIGVYIAKLVGNCTVQRFHAIAKITSEMLLQQLRGDPRLLAEASELKDIANLATKSLDLCWFAPCPHVHMKIT